MNPKEVTAEAFWTAFKALSKKEQEAVITRLIQDDDFVENLLDIALIEEARREPGQDIPLREYIAKRNKGCPHLSHPSPA